MPLLTMHRQDNTRRRTAPTLRHVMDALLDWSHIFSCAVIKPIYGAASIGVVKVEGMEGLKLTYKRVAKEMAGARIVDGAMQAGAADDEEVDQVQLLLLLSIFPHLCCDHAASSAQTSSS